MHRLSRVVAGLAIGAAHFRYELLKQYRVLYRALAAAWSAAHDMQKAAESEAATEPPTPVDVLPAVVAEQITARHQVWRDTAVQRAALAGEHATQLYGRAERAARAYAAAALRLFHAAVTGTDPVAGVPGPGPGRHVGRTAAGAGRRDRHLRHRRRGENAIRPCRGRPGEAPRGGTETPRYHPDPRVRTPGAALAELADFLLDETAGGALLRRLHP